MKITNLKIQTGLYLFLFQHSTQHIVGIQQMNVTWILNYKIFNVFGVNVSWSLKLKLGVLQIFL